MIIIIKRKKTKATKTTKQKANRTDIWSQSTTRDIRKQRDWIGPVSIVSANWLCRNWPQVLQSNVGELKPKNPVNRPTIATTTTTSNKQRKVKKKKSIKKKIIKKITIKWTRCYGDKNSAWPVYYFLNNEKWLKTWNCQTKQWNLPISTK